MTTDTSPPGGSPLRDSARRTLQLEQQAIAALVARLDGGFDRACELILACRGRVVVTGMGKSGHIAGKIAATLASTGTPAFFVHPGEASHGDLGMITPGDVVLALSNSGETAEVTALLPLLKRMGTPLISMTGRPGSTLARHAEAHLDAGVAREACPLDLAPTSSTTAALALGDALAVALLESRGFTAEDFARSHPGGSLGKRLLLRVSDLMHRDSRLPSVPLGSPLRDALLEITRQGARLHLRGRRRRPPGRGLHRWRPASHPGPAQRPLRPQGRRRHDPAGQAGHRRHPGRRGGPHHGRQSHHRPGRGRADHHGIGRCKLSDLFRNG